MRIKIKEGFNNPDPNYANITPGSEHETVDVPREDANATYVNGVKGPALLSTEDYDILAEDKIVLTAYNVKTKQKNVPIQEAVITKTARGAYMAQGNDGNGQKLTTLLTEAKALKAIEQGVAKKGW